MTDSVKNLRRETAKIMQDIKMETFITVCDYQNFTKAANALGLTQPAVSRQMKSLEEYYNVDLFYFEGKKLFLTEAGKTLYHFAKNLQNDENKLKKQLKEHAVRTLYLGSTPTPGEFMLPKILFSYLKEHPTPKVYLTIQNTEALLEKIDNGKIDLALVEGNFPKKEYEHLFFSNQNYMPVCASNHNFAETATKTSIESLLSQTLIIRERGSGNREILEHSLKCHNLSLSDFASTIETNDIKIQKALIQQGCGIAFLFEAAIEKEKNLKRIPIHGFPIKHEINLIWRKNSFFQEEYLKLALYFRNHIRNHKETNP